MTSRRRDRRPDEETFRFDRTVLGVRVTRRSGTRSWRQFEADNSILTKLRDNGQVETIRLFQDGKLDMPQLRAADARGELASGTLLQQIAVREPLWSRVETTIGLMGSGSTFTRYRVAFAALRRKGAKYLGDKALVADLEHVPWRELHDVWAASGSDWNHVRRAVSRFLSVLLGKHHPFRHTVVDKIPVAAEVEREPDITAESFWLAVSKAPEYVRPAFVTLVATGMRWGEYARTRKSHLRPRTLGVQVPGTKTAASLATVYVSEWLWPWIEQGIPAPLSYEHTYKHWKRACVAAGLGEFRDVENARGYTGPHLHDLRHLHGQLAIDAVDVTKVADGLRHTQLATTRRYVRKRNKQDVAAAVGDALKPAAGGTK
jgi:integrase